MSPRPRPVGAAYSDVLFMDYIMVRLKSADCPIAFLLHSYCFFGRSPRSILDRHAAVDLEGLPRVIARFIGGEEHRAGSDLLGSSQPADRLAVDEILAHRIG